MVSVEDWKVKIQYMNGSLEVTDWMTEKKAKDKFEKLKSERINKQIVWCELIHSPLDADEQILITDFESEIIDTGFGKLLV